MLETIIKVFNVIEITILFAAILGVFYDFCRDAFSSRAAIFNI